MRQEPAVVYCFDRHFRHYAAVSTHSLLLNARQAAKVYWLVPADEVSDIAPLAEMLEKTARAHIEMVGVRQDLFADWKTSYHFTHASYLRLLIPQSIAEDRVLYLDADTLVLADIGELYARDMAGNVLGGVQDIAGGNTSKVPRAPGDPYVNAGVLLMDLAALRRDDFLGQSISLYEEFRDQIVWLDQCIINKYAENRKLVLDGRWNRQFHANALNTVQFETLFSDRNSAILHFVGIVKPWQKWCNPRVFAFWWNYANRLGIKDLAPQEITGIDQALSLAGSLDLNEMYKDASMLKSRVIEILLQNLKKPS